MPYSVPRPPVAIDKHKKSVFNSPSEVTSTRALNTVTKFISTNGVLGTLKALAQANKGTNVFGVLAKTNAITNSRIETLIEPYYTVLDSPGNIQDIFVAQYTTAGNVSWIAKVSGPNMDNAYGISTDSSGNINVAGKFTSSTLTAYDKDNRAFDKILVNTNSGDGVGVGFIVQYSPAGAVNWIAKLGGNDNVSIAEICTDSDQNINVTGTFTCNPLTAYNANGTAFTTTLSNAGGVDAFIAQYSSTGTVNWVARIAGTGSDGGSAITTDPSNNIFVIGTFSSSTLRAYNKTGTVFGTTLTNSGSVDSFVVKYTSAGTVSWVTRIGGTGADVAYAICTDSDGKINVTGSFTSSTLTAYNSNGTPFATTVTNSGGNDVFLVQFTPNGGVNWISKLSGSGTDYGYAICTDSAKNINITGIFTSTTLTAYGKTGSAFGSTLTRDGGGGVDIFVAQYSSTGNVNWISQIGGVGNDLSSGISADSSGKISVVGTFDSSQLTAYNGSGVAFETTLTNTGGSNGFIAQYSLTGDVNWLRKLGGNGLTGFRATSNDSGGNINVCGYYTSTNIPQIRNVTVYKYPDM
jgi:hypothetical protein